MSFPDTGQAGEPGNYQTSHSYIVDEEKPCCSKTLSSRTTKTSPSTTVSPNPNLSRGPVLALSPTRLIFDTVIVSDLHPSCSQLDIVSLDSSTENEFERSQQEKVITVEPSLEEQEHPTESNPTEQTNSNEPDGLLTTVFNRNPSSQASLVQSVADEELELEVSEQLDIQTNIGTLSNTKAKATKAPAVKRSVWLLQDENGNQLDEECPTSEEKYLEHATYLFDKGRRHHLARTISLLPRHREFVVFNVFTDLARLVGIGKRVGRKRVAFPEEVMEQYAQKGDVAGKDRFVPVAKTPYKDIQPTKKRRLSAVYTSWSVKSTEFVPRVERIDDYSKWEHCCERHLFSCDWCGCVKPKKPDLTTVMEGYLCDLNGASLFLHGHATRTFDSAISTLEFANMGRVSIMSFSAPLALSKHRIGVLSGSIWIFGYCVRTILRMVGDPGAAANMTLLPTENGFRKNLEQFAALCLLMEEGAKIVLQYSHNFYNFCKECIRIIKVLQIHVKFGGEFRLRKPLRRGDGLELDKKLRKPDIIQQKSVAVLVAKATANDPAGGEEEDDGVMEEWRTFEELTGPEKTHCLRHLLTSTSEGLTLVQTQLRFLIDDIVDSVRDVEEADLLFILADMYDRIKFLENVGSSKYIKDEMGQIARLMTEFSKDFQSFIDYGQLIMKRFIEVRDMIHLCYEFLANGLKLELISEMVPGYTYKKRRGLGCLGCCCCGGGESVVGRRRKVVKQYQPKYTPLDFFRVAYKEIVQCKGQIYCNRYYIQLVMKDVELIEAIVPKNLVYNWNDEDNSPRLSLEEYVDNLDEEETQGPEPVKPILISSPGGSPTVASPTGSPTASPRGSVTSVGEEEKPKGSGAGDT